MEDDVGNKTVLEVLEEGEREVLSEGPPPANLKQLQLFTRVMNRIKNAYQKEKAKKESASIATSVKTVLRNRKSNAQEDVENDSTEDEEATHSLENEIEVTRRLLEVSLIREEQSKQRIAALDADVAKLRVMVEEGEALRRDEGLSLQELIALKKQLIVDNEKLLGENQLFSQQSALLRIELQELQEDKKRVDNRLDQLQQQLAKRREELDKELKESQETREKLADVTSRLEEREIQVTKLSHELETVQEERQVLETDNVALEERTVELEQSCTDLAERYNTVVEEFEVLRAHFIGLDGENATLSEQIKQCDTQIAKRMREINELEHYQKAANHHIEQYDAEYKRADVEREILESQLKALEGELERLRQLVASERIRTDKVFRENHTLQKQLNEMLCVREKQGDVWSQQQQTIKRLEQQVTEEEQAKIYLKAQLKEAQNEMNRFGLELEALRKELINVAGLWKAKEKECAQLMEEVAHLEKQIKRNQGAGEAIQLSKSALEMENSKIKEENVHLERRMKTMTFMIENLKGELASKEALLVQEKHAKQKVERQLNSLKKTVDEEKKKREDFGSKSSITPIDRQHTKILLALQQANNDLKEAHLVIQSEKRTCQHLEQKLANQKVQWDETVTQLQNAERQLQEQAVSIKQLQTQLAVLCTECERLEREKKSIIQKFNQTATLQSEFELLRETLLHEQSRASALEVEKRTPVRIHPWRTLQYTDPASYVAMMRDQAAKRSRMSGDRCNKSRHKLPDLLPKRPASHDLSHRRNEDGFQSALIKAVL